MMFLQTAATQATLSPNWMIGILFILEVITGIVLEKKRRRVKSATPAEISRHMICTEHSDVISRLIRIEKKLDQTEVTGRLDKINDLLIDLKKGAQI